jgi:hypothetical protein
MSQLRSMLITAAQVSLSMSLGDIVCQCLEHRTTSIGDTFSLFDVKVDWSRTSRMCLTGAFVSGPWSFGQYQVFERFIPGTTTAAVVKKVAAAAAAAPIGISLMFTSVLLLQGKKYNDVQHKLQNDLVDTWAIGALYWPFVLGLNFKFVSLARRPLVGALAGSAWNVYTAYQANKVVPSASSSSSTAVA